jgi:flavodoxin
MRALVVFESMFGNTQQIAQAVADGLRRYARVKLVEVGDAPTELDNDLDLLVVGGPTHAHGLSRQATRDQAAGMTKTGVVSRHGGLREWLARLAPTSGMKAATFDTRLDKPRWLVGSAARTAAKGLSRRGYSLAAVPESFLVSGTLGPLRDGEVERARQWGASLGSAPRSAGSRVTFTRPGIGRRPTIPRPGGPSAFPPASGKARR